MPPVVDLPRDDGWISVIGGYVYRGDAIPELQGRYIFSDWIRAGIATISYDGNGEPLVEDLIPGANGASTFSEDNAGNIWQVHMWGGFNRLVATESPAPTEFPTTLSATGCFATDNIRRPAPGVVPYDINSPLWSDGAAKERFFALPNESTITVQGNGLWSFPVGTVLIKTFLVQDVPVETRLLVRHDDGEWAGYSYEWNDAGTDAVLLASSKSKLVGGQTWRFPSRAQCLGCHTAPNGDVAAERVLALNTAQVNRDYIYPENRVANQIQTLAGIGYFAEDPGPHGSLAALPDPSDDAHPLSDRARAYLQANCANCHQPNGPGRGGIDFRFATPVSDGGYCDSPPSFGSLDVEGAQLLTPGDAGASIIPLRMKRTDAHRMPPLGVSLIDMTGVGVVEAWINGLSACP